MRIEKWVVADHVDGVPDVTRMYRKVTENLDVDLRPDEMLLRTRWVSIDPYLHGIALDTPLGNHQGADTIMEVVEAGPKAAHRVGDLVQGFGGWRTHLVSNGAPRLWETGTFPMVFPAYRRLDPKLFDDTLPVTTALGVLGGAGMTAWGTVTKFLDVQPGHTVVVSGASGTVGSLLGQLAKRAGATVIGTTSSPAKADLLNDVGFDHVLLYRHGDDPARIGEALRAAAPGGVDRYVDNLGGAVTDAVFGMLTIGSRVAVSWQWSTQVAGDVLGPRLLPYLMFPRATVRGIFAPEWFTDDNWEALHEDVGGMIRRGEVSWQQTVRRGFDAIPETYRSLYANPAANRGKVLVEV